MKSNKPKSVSSDKTISDIEKKRKNKVTKKETKEVTGTGASSGSYSSPVFGDSAFTAKSNAEVPKKVEANEVTGASSSGGVSVNSSGFTSNPSGSLGGSGDIPPGVGVGPGDVDGSLATTWSFSVFSPPYLKIRDKDSAALSSSCILFNQYFLPSTCASHDFSPYVK